MKSSWSNNIAQLGEVEFVDKPCYREKVHRLLRASVAPETRRAYSSRLKHFFSWCEDEGVPAFPASPEILAAYVAHLADRCASCSTVGQTMAASEEDGDSASREGDFFFLDENGIPTDVVSGDASKMKVVVYMLASKTYPDAFITMDATEADKTELETLA